MGTTITIDAGKGRSQGQKPKLFLMAPGGIRSSGVFPGLSWATRFLISVTGAHVGRFCRVWPGRLLPGEGEIPKECLPGPWGDAMVQLWLGRFFGSFTGCARKS